MEQPEIGPPNARSVAVFLYARLGDAWRRCWVLLRLKIEAVRNYFLSWGGNSRVAEKLVL